MEVLTQIAYSGGLQQWVQSTTFLNVPEISASQVAKTYVDSLIKT